MWFVGCRLEIDFLKCLFGLFLLICCWNKRKANFLHYHAISGNEIQCEFLAWILCNAGGSHTSLLWARGWIQLEFLPEPHHDPPICWQQPYCPPQALLNFFASIYNSLISHSNLTAFWVKFWEPRLPEIKLWGALTTGAGEGSSTQALDVSQAKHSFSRWRGEVGWRKHQYVRSV